jgi:hypothetical protein
MDSEHLAWLAAISTEHENGLRRRPSDQKKAAVERRQLEWLASISTTHETKLRRVVAAEAEAREARERFERFLENPALQEAEWDPAKHPRRGGPPNAGWFATTSGTGGSSGASGSQSGQDQVALGDTSSDVTAPPATKPQLPAGDRGSWISGTKGEGVFRYNDSVENQKAGLAGKEARFENQRIAVGGLPAEAYYGGNASEARVEVSEVTGLDADNASADAAMRKKLGKPDWQRPKGYVWNHAGPPGSKTMELVDERVHRAVSHKGPAAEPRALRRAAKSSTRGAAGKATGRAMGALTVYLTVREALQAAGILQPDYEVVEHETYHYVAEDGSVFIVWTGGLLTSAKREFVAGPRKGETEKISKEQVEAYRKQAEEEWGKYIPGSLLSEPRFIPGKKRKSLPLIEYRNGVPFEAGWIDEDGVHRETISRTAII